MNLKTLSKRVKKNTTLAEGEVYLVLTEAATSIAECLLDGSTVSIDGLGSFRLTAQSEGTETMEECTAACIKSVKVGFTAAENFKDQLKSATFTLASGMVTEK